MGLCNTRNWWDLSNLARLGKMQFFPAMLAAVLASTAGTLLVSIPANAQTNLPAAKQVAVPNLGSSDLATIQRRRQVLFQHMLQHPDDLDVAFEYAALSVRAGDLEGAVGTLERMLIFAPGLPRLQLELGLLYYRLGANPTAQSYLEAAISGPNVPDPVRQRVDKLLAGIAKQEDGEDFSGQQKRAFRPG